MKCLEAEHHRCEYATDGKQVIIEKQNIFLKFLKKGINLRAPRHQGSKLLQLLYEYYEFCAQYRCIFFWWSIFSISTLHMKIDFVSPIL
jgi:hypothetical protein